jgi:hypothetical protein
MEKKGSPMTDLREFSEVGHCGGTLTVTVLTSPEGKRQYQLGYEHSSPRPSSISNVFSTFEGEPIAFVAIGGMGAETNTPVVPGISTLLASDEHGLYGHECPRCKGYWRTDGFPVYWVTTCPYCALRAAPHYFLTKGQRRYIEECCKLVVDAMEKPDGDYVIDFDAVADAARQGTETPKFFYAEQTQQHKYVCDACGSVQDILGKYGFCSSCGTRNDLMVVRAGLKHIRDRVEAGENLVSCLKDSVTEFDSASRAIAKSLAAMVKMKPGRKSELQRMLFHNVTRRAEEMRNWFDIDIFKGMRPEKVSFVQRMFARRHVYEHNGGEVDERYINETGDQSVKPKQLIRESRESVLETIAAVENMTENFHTQFHEIFPPDPKPISYHRPSKGR